MQKWKDWNISGEWPNRPYDLSYHIFRLGYRFLVETVIEAEAQRRGVTYEDVRDSLTQEEFDKLLEDELYLMAETNSGIYSPEWEAYVRERVPGVEYDP